MNYNYGQQGIMNQQNYIPNNPPNVVYPNQPQNMTPQQGYPTQQGYPPQYIAPMNQNNFITPDINCKKCKGTGIRDKSGKKKKCKCIKKQEKEMEKYQKKEQKKIEKYEKKMKKDLKHKKGSSSSSDSD